MVTPAKRSRATYKSIADSSAVTSTELPATLRGARKQPTKKQLEELLKAEDAEINAAFGGDDKLEDVQTIPTIQDIIRRAFENKDNYDNVLLLEWSEAVILQLCDVTTPLNFRRMSWKEARKIYLPNIFSKTIAITLKNNSGLNFNLDYYIQKNHNWKVKHFNMPDSDMFVTRPTINYNLLQHYTETREPNYTPIKRLVMQRKTSEQVCK